VVTYYPFVLDPSNPSAAATTGDNVLDNVEQVLIEAPGVSGIYTVEVGHKGILANNLQHYSLILSGQMVEERVAADINDDGSIDSADLLIIAEYWLDFVAAADISPDGGDGIINFLDVSAFAEGPE
jgi:hypothetical protein